jgi:hypothetical protein
MFGFLFKNRFDLDKPLTLLGKYYFDIQNKLSKKGYNIFEENDNDLTYFKDSYADSTEEFSGWLNVRVMCNVKYLENPNYDHVIFSAGKIFFDESESVIDNIINEITFGKCIVNKKKKLYDYNSDAYLKVNKYYDDYYDRWYCEIDYIAKNLKERYTVKPKSKINYDDILKKELKNLK